MDADDQTPQLSEVASHYRGLLNERQQDGSSLPWENTAGSDCLYEAIPDEIILVLAAMFQLESWTKVVQLTSKTHIELIGEITPEDFVLLPAEVKDLIAIPPTLPKIATTLAKTDEWKRPQVISKLRKDYDQEKAVQQTLFDYLSPETRQAALRYRAETERERGQSTGRG